MLHTPYYLLHVARKRESERGSEEHCLFFFFLGLIVYNGSGGIYERGSKSVSELPVLLLSAQLFFVLLFVFV